MMKQPTDITKASQIRYQDIRVDDQAMIKWFADSQTGPTTQVASWLQELRLLGFTGVPNCDRPSVLGPEDPSGSRGARFGEPMRRSFQQGTAARPLAGGHRLP